MQQNPHARQRVRSHLQQLMVKGDLHPGKKVNLPTVARQLDLSVTPVREALTQLCYTGVLEAIPLRGFFIPQLSAAEARILYHSIVALETEALRLLFPVHDSVLSQLKVAERTFRTATSSAQRLAADTAFHDILTAPFSGTPSDNLLQDYKVRILFYERAYLQDLDLVEASIHSHEQLVTALEAQDLASALQALRQNWLNVATLLQPRIQSTPS